MSVNVGQILACVGKGWRREVSANVFQDTNGQRAIVRTRMSALKIRISVDPGGFAAILRAAMNAVKGIVPTLMAGETAHLMK